MCDLHRQDPSIAVLPPSVEEFVEELVVSMTNGRIYRPDHPRIGASIERLMGILCSLTKPDEQESLVIGCADGYLFHGSRPLVGASLAAIRLVNKLSDLGAGGLSFDHEALAEEFCALVGVLLLGKQGFSEANSELLQRGCKHIRFLPSYACGDGDGRVRDIAAEYLNTGRIAGGLSSAGAGSLRLPTRLYQSVVDTLQDTMIRACRHDIFEIDQARTHVEAILGRLTEDATTMMRICRYEQYDAFTFGHSIRVCCLALNFARNLTRDEAVLSRIGTAALLHDVGKAWVPFEILHSRDRLSQEERIEMSRHSDYGAEILVGLPSADRVTVAGAFGHHRTIDGGGYPRTRLKENQSFVTRLIKICDAFEALTAVRPYKAGMSPTRAYRIMLTMKDHFDPAILRSFIEATGIYPIGSMVRLSTNETARVLAQSMDLRLPRVQLETSADGAPLHSEDRREVDLLAGVLSDKSAATVAELLKDSPA